MGGEERRDYVPDRRGRISDRHRGSLVNWLSLAPYIALGAVILGLGIDDGIQRVKVDDRDVTIANDVAQEAKNVAAAKQAVLDAAAKDALATNAILTKLQADNAALTKESADAQVALATAPVVSAPPGCPDIMASPLVGSFLRSLPN